LGCERNERAALPMSAKQLFSAKQLVGAISTIAALKVEREER